MRHRTPACLLLLSLAVIAIAGCERSRESVVEAPQRESLVVLRRVNGGDPQTLDPARAEDEHAFNVLTDLYEGLLVLDAKGNLIPGVAEDWELSSDGHSYTFHLNTNARWSNGERVTAEHFLTSFSRTLTPTTRSPYSFLLHPIRNAAEVARGELPPSALGVTAVDIQTLKIELHSPAPHFLSVLAMPIAFPLWPDALEHTGQFADPLKFVGNGPFLLQDRRPGHRISLRKNSEYRDAHSVDVDVVEYYPIQDPLTELNMFRASDLDITATVPGANVKSLRNTHDGDQSRFTHRNYRTRRDEYSPKAATR